MTTKHKIRVEIIPEDDVDANKLQDNIRSLLSSNRNGCKTLRVWIESTKECEATCTDKDIHPLDCHKCTLLEGHKEKHRCICGFSWDVI